MSTTTPSRDHYDVVVAGARVAGAATAMLLARSGLRVLVVDRSEAGADTLSTHALMRGGVLQLHRWGLLAAVVAARTPPIRRTSFVYADDRVDITIRPSHGVDALYAPRRTVLDPLLVEAARDAGAEVLHRTSLEALRWEGGRVVGAKIVPAGGVGRDVRCAVVVGADGIRSTVARLVGAPVVRQAAHTAAATYGYWSDVEVDGYEWVFRRDACAGIIPTNDGQACVFASAQPGVIGRGGADAIRRVVAVGHPDLAARLAAGTAPAGTRTWTGHPGFFRRSHGPGWALVGDAGYFKDPISAHGLTDALRDAELLARAIVEGLAGRVEPAAALAGYEALRDRLSTPLFEVTERIASNEWDDAEIGSLLLQLSASMADEVEALASLDAGVGR